MHLFDVRIRQVTLSLYVIKQKVQPFALISNDLGCACTNPSRCTKLFYRLQSQIDKRFSRPTINSIQSLNYASLYGPTCC